MSLTAISGWVFRASGAAPGHVRLVADDGRVLAEQTADRLREDVAAVWHGSARCGFDIDLPVPLLPGQTVGLEIETEVGSETLQSQVHLIDCEPADLARVVCHVVDQPQDYPYAGAQLDSVAALVADRDPEWRCELADQILRLNERQIGPELVKFLRAGLAPDDDPRLLEKLIAVELADRRLRDPLTRNSTALQELVANRHAADLPDGRAISDTIMWAARNHDAALMDTALPLVKRRETAWRWGAALRLTHMLVDAAGAMPSPLSGSELNELSPVDLSRMLSATAPLLATRVGPVAETLAHELAYIYNPASQVAAFNVHINRRSRGQMRGPRSPMQSVSRIYSPDTGLLTLPRNEVSTLTIKSSHERSEARSAGEGGTGPRISIVVPVRNGMPYIQRAISSILTQDYGNFQVIVIDGASTDGTAEFLASIAHHFDYFVSEADGGQSQAINKGLAQAEGDYVGWLNADDELLPGALTEVAAAAKRTHADILAGIAVVERDGLIEMVTRTQMQPGTLSREGLLNLFGKWFKGFYFYQPEVFIRKAALERAGAHVAEDLYFTMDYDLWLRLADQGVQVALCDWPLALFRQHPDQKTADLTSTTTEQLTVWERHHPEIKPPIRLADLAGVLGIRPSGGRPRVLFHSTRLAKVFSPRIRVDLPVFMDQHGVDLVMPDRDGRVDDLGSVDLAVLPIHVMNEHELIRRWRREGLDAAVVGWLWDNHHSHIAHAELLPELDVVVPGHSVPQGPLRELGRAWTETVPLCVSQWTSNELADLWLEQDIECDRSEAVMGGFVDYYSLGSRSESIRRVMRMEGFQDIRLISESELLDSYFSWPASRRFREWVEHKISLVWPLRNDLSQRFFDALVSGQVPMVVEPPRDLEVLLGASKELRNNVVLVESTDAADLASARRKAIAIFDELGVQGAIARHKLGLEHTLEQRLLSIIRAALDKGTRETDRG